MGYYGYILAIRMFICQHAAEDKIDCCPSLRRVGTVESHNDRVRFRWEVVPPDGGDPVITGTDTGIVAPDGRLRLLSGFFDSVTM